MLLKCPRFHPLLIFIVSNDVLKGETVLAVLLQQAVEIFLYSKYSSLRELTGILFSCMCFSLLLNAIRINKKKERTDRLGITQTTGRFTAQDAHTLSVFALVMLNFCLNSFLYYSHRTAQHIHHVYMQNNDMRRKRNN